MGQCKRSDFSPNPDAPPAPPRAPGPRWACRPAPRGFRPVRAASPCLLHHLGAGERGPEPETARKRRARSHETGTPGHGAPSRRRHRETEGGAARGGGSRVSQGQPRETGATAAGVAQSALRVQPFLERSDVCPVRFTRHAVYTDGDIPRRSDAGGDRSVDISPSHSGFGFTAIGYRRLDDNASRVQAGRRSRDHRRLPLHARQPSCGPKRVHRLK